MGRFSPEEYTWIAPGKGAAQVGAFVATVFSLMGVIYMFYPDKPAVPRTFPHAGLEKALGGPRALPVGRLVLQCRRRDIRVMADFIRSRRQQRGRTKAGQAPSCRTVSMGGVSGQIIRSNTSILDVRVTPHTACRHYRHHLQYAFLLCRTVTLGRAGDLILH